MASQAGPNPATPVSSVAASTAANSSAAASSNAAASSAAPAASSQSQAASSVAASSAAQSSAAASSAASSAAASSAPASSAAQSSTAASLASSSASSSSASASRSTTATIASAAASSTSTSSKLSGGAIGGIVGGVVGGVVLVVLLWVLLRRRKEKKNRVLPPPPRDFREMTFAGPSSRPRMGSNNMMSASHRASSYSTLLQNGRPSSTAPRSPSYYHTYPIATPSTLPDSPPMPASISTESPASGSSQGHSTPAMKPVLAPLNTGLQRDNSDSSNEQEFGVLPKHKSSIDRLRYEGSDRAPSPSVNGDSSRATSPHPSMYGLPSPSSFPRHSFNPDGQPPRPLSMTSISSRAQSQSSRYLTPHAPHGGRVQPQMPKPLGARPDSSGDFFWQTPKIPQGFDVGFDGSQNRRMSRAATELDMYTSGGGYSHDRMPSSQSSKSTIAKPPRIHSHTPDDGRQAHHSRSMQSMRAQR